MLLANVNKLAERPGALGHRGPLGLYVQIGSGYRQQDAGIGRVLRNEEGVIPIFCPWH